MNRTEMHPVNNWKAWNRLSVVTAGSIALVITNDKQFGVVALHVVFILSTKEGNKRFLVESTQLLF